MNALTRWLNKDESSAVLTALDKTQGILRLQPIPARLLR